MWHAGNVWCPKLPGGHGCLFFPILLYLVYFTIISKDKTSAEPCVE